jgi:hypothetical protein
MREVLRDLRAEILSLKVMLGEEGVYQVPAKEYEINAKIEALEWVYGLIQKKGLTL